MLTKLLVWYWALDLLPPPSASKMRMSKDWELMIEQAHTG
jgi:hypothetical protein